MGRLSRRDDLRSGNVSADVIRVMRRRRWEAWWEQRWKLRGEDVPVDVWRMVPPAVYFVLVVLLFPVGVAYQEFTGMFERAEHWFEWTEPMSFETAPEDYELRRRVRRAVHSVLMEIGHGVTVSSVEVMDLDDLGFAAVYYRNKDTIVFSSRVDWDEDTLLGGAGHETSHALWARLPLEYDGDPAYLRLINEVTAYVLGAHLAGRARAREGRNGDRLRELLVADYRTLCDDSNPESVRNRIAGAWVFMRGDLAVPYDYEHFGSVEMVDEMDAICSRHPYDAVKAALAIRDRYLPKPPPPPKAGEPTPTPSASSQVEW